MRWLEFLKLRARPSTTLSPLEAARLSELDAEDLRRTDQLAWLEIPAILAVGAVLLVLGGLVVLWLRG